MKAIKKIFSAFGNFIDKCIVVPITKFILKITGGFDKSGRKVEKWLSKTNTLLFISLFLALTVFIVLDQKIISFNENSAEILKSQPVKAIYNEEAYVVEGLPEEVDITLIGSKTDLYIAKQSVSNGVTVDLTGLKPGQHKINIKYNQGNETIDYKVNPSVATVIIYPKESETKILTLDLLNKENLDSKLSISKMDIESDRVTIKGATEQIKKVAIVKGLVNVDNIVRPEIGVTTIKDVPLKAYDASGNAVDVELVPSKVDVDLTIVSPSKQVPINVIPQGDLAFGSAIASIEQSETTVTIYGDEESLAKVSYIPIYVDVEGLKEDYSFKTELDKPVGIRTMDINSVNVKLSVSSSTDIDIPNVIVGSRNLDTKKYSAVGENKVTVNVKGVESVIKQIKAQDIDAYIDLAGYVPGEYEVEVQVEGNDPKVTYVSKTKRIKITITEN